MTPTILEFVTDPQLLGLSLSPAQETLLKSIYGLALTDEELAIFQRCTGRDTYPGEPFGEATVVAGARAGKDSRIAAPIVCYEAIFGGHEKYLSKGERGVIPLVAQDARAAKIALGYIGNYLTRSPLLSSLVEDALASEITLKNGLSIVCFPCTQRSLRGWSIPAGVLDELAFFRLEGQADSDVEIQASIRRGMLNFPQPRLVKISTPYMKSGVLYDDFKLYFGQDSPDVLVWRASSLFMNPSLKAGRLKRQQRLDPGHFAREYEAEFAEDLESFLPSAWVDGAVMSGRYELPPQPSLKYVAAVDSSGGGADAFVATVVHPEGQGASRRVVQDFVRGWSKARGGQVDLEGIVKEISDHLKRYGCFTVIGDRYAKQWVIEAFRRYGITYAEPTLRKAREMEGTYLDKSAAYLEVEPLFAQRQIHILDHPRLIQELKNLERRPQAGGKTIVDHPHGSHDDYANALCLAAAKARQGPIVPRAGAAIPHGVTVIGTPSSLLSPGGGIGNRGGGINAQERYKEGP